MSRSPNAEQKLAIEHEGGVLLRAGAGSGKTFVLVEHILYLTKQWIERYKAAPRGTFEEYLRSEFSKVVMMTFTKKAAGEMSIRLAEKFQSVSSEEGENQKFWIIANELLPVLTVTTIDGFCRKLITLGYFPHLSTEAKIIFETERTDQVKELVEEWLGNNHNETNPDLLDIIIKEKRALLSAFTNIFSDPGLRFEWKNFSMEDIAPETIDGILEKSFKLNNLSESLFKIHALDIPEESERSAFEKTVATFQATGLPEVKNLESFQVYTQLYSQIKRLTGEMTASKKRPAATDAKDGMSELRDWIKKWEEVIGDYQSNFEDKVKPWMNLCQELYHFIDSRLDPNRGMTFGDIEYYVSLGLKNSNDRERIQKNYSYFIVDEFQDTSNIQFNIIQNLIGGDYSKLFCVGDAKQAIYGFRGGELSVFSDCENLVPQVRTLANNYRSLPEVIRFNNSLFRSILPLGQNYEGHDPFTVKPEDQNVPVEVSHSSPGSIETLEALLERDLEEEGKFSSEDINKIESNIIADSIKKEREETGHVCTVLYSKLRPSGELIRALMERKIGFTAQFKIDLLDDPVLGLFVSLLKRKFDSNVETKNHFPKLIFQSYFKVLGIEKHITDKLFEEFDKDVQYWGLNEAFIKFLFKLGITNENSDINIQTIATISELYSQDPESIMIQLSQGDNQRLSLDLRSGENSNMVQIMSAHASKGLEFDVVYLGGIYTNGRDQNDGPLFGNLPGSFNWYKDLTQREKQKSPRYVYENELSRYKNFSESKRLFYVATTRAKKKLVWVNLEIPEKAFSIPKNSWILGLNYWLQNGEGTEKLNAVSLNDFNNKELLSSQSIPELPLFFHDPVGIFSKGKAQAELMIAAELSVTRLNSLMDCPRKFYLSNILKMPEPQEKKQIFFEMEDEELATIVRSSSERGTQIHEQIAKGITRNFIVPRESFENTDRAPIEWVLGELKPLQDQYEFISEKQIKFKFFNFMISGIPDLVLLPKGDQKTQIWDFKTGRITQESLNHYWLQLSIYAYAMYELKMVDKNTEIFLNLSFVDQKKNLSEVTTWEKCKADLYPIWRSQNEPWRTNLEHCAQCSYGSICPR